MVVTITVTAACRLPCGKAGLTEKMVLIIHREAQPRAEERSVGPVRQTLPPGGRQSRERVLNCTRSSELTPASSASGVIMDSKSLAWRCDF